jgi:hypothetical protein
MSNFRESLQKGPPEEEKPQAKKTEPDYRHLGPYVQATYDKVKREQERAAAHREKHAEIYEAVKGDILESIQVWSEVRLSDAEPTIIVEDPKIHNPGYRKATELKDNEYERVITVKDQSGKLMNTSFTLKISNSGTSPDDRSEISLTTYAIDQNGKPQRVTAFASTVEEAQQKIQEALVKVYPQDVPPPPPPKTAEEKARDHQFWLDSLNRGGSKPTGPMGRSGY